MMYSTPYDAIIIGAGFGGSVSAARLAEKGLRVLILERGPWWGPLNGQRPGKDHRDFPRGFFASRKLLRNLRVARRGRRFEKVLHADGFFEVHTFDHLTTLTSSGVGGGSLHYTGIMEEPPAEFFEAYPEEISGDEMRPYFHRVRDVLRPSPVPDPPEKNRVFEKAVRAAGLPAVEYPDLAVAWGRDPRRPEAVTNAAGVRQTTSTYQGDVFAGCTDGSKTTLDLTYIPIALRNGAELRPLCEVMDIAAAANGGYRLRYVDHRSGQQITVKTPRLVLAAGCLNTLRLLFTARHRDHGLPGLPATLGRRFSVNGDRDSLLWRSRVLRDASWGTSFNAFSRICDHARHRFLIGEVGLPVQSMPIGRPFAAWLRRSTFFFCMGRDKSTGIVSYDGKGLTTPLSRAFDAALFDAMDAAAARVAHHYRGRRFLSGMLAGPDPLGLFSVHPMGGCSMGRSAEEGVTDHRGEIFGYPGLFVADASLYPRSPGIAPSMTIAALAERQAALID